MAKITTEVRLVLEKPGTTKATYSDIDGLVTDKIYVKRDYFNGRPPPKNITMTINWET